MKAKILIDDSEGRWKAGEIGEVCMGEVVGKDLEGYIIDLGDETDDGGTMGRTFYFYKGEVELLGNKTYSFVDAVDQRGIPFSIVKYDDTPIAVIKQLSEDGDYRLFTVPLDNQISGLVDASYDTKKSMEYIKEKIQEIDLGTLTYKDGNVCSVRGIDLTGCYRYYGIDQQSGGYPYWGSSIQSNKLLRKEEVNKLIEDVLYANKIYYLPMDVWKIDVLVNGKVIESHTTALLEEYKDFIKKAFGYEENKSEDSSTTD